MNKKQYTPTTPSRVGEWNDMKKDKKEENLIAERIKSGCSLNYVESKDNYKTDEVIQDFQSLSFFTNIN